MRKEYTNINQASDVFYAIDNFFAYSQISSLYTLIDSRTDRRVYHNISENLDLIFYYVTETIYHNDSDNVILLVTTEYDTSKDVWFQQDVICNGIKVHDAGSIKRAIYYFPAPTLIVPTTGTSQPHKLVINFNSENKTFMLSLVGAYDFISQGSVGGVYTAHRTSSICFGMVRKALDFEGGFFYGGDFVYTYEWIYGENNSGSTVANYVYAIYDSTFNNITLHAFQGTWYNDPYSMLNYAPPPAVTYTNPNNVNRLDLILRINVDNAPNRNKNNIVKPPDTDTTVTPPQPYFKTPPPTVIRNQTWATTMKLGYYVRMVCSITNLSDLLPRYTPLLSDTPFDDGRALNMINKISPVMPLWFMIQRDPIEQDIYSYAGKNEVINFVNMRYMDTNRIKESTFPTTGEKYTYNCFQMGSRRAWFGMKGYSGLAFKIEEGEASIPYFSLLDINTMDNHRTNDIPILNLTVGTNKGYGGDTEFDNMPNGSFILKVPYVEFLSLTFTFCDDSGTVIDSVTWDRNQLDMALSGTEEFNLLPDTSTIIGGEWIIKPFAEGSTSTMFICASQNCGLVGLVGNI